MCTCSLEVVALITCLVYTLSSRKYFCIAVVLGLYDRCRRKLRFKDGATRVYVTTQLIDACALLPGDVIHVHSARQRYSWALVCDVITSQQQQLYKVALADGRVVL